MKQQARQLGQRLFVNRALELDHGIERHPVVAPTPGIELRLGRGAQADVAVAAGQPQQEPDLLLSLVGAAPLAAHPLFRNVVSQPVARAAEDAHMLGLKPDLLVQFAEHRLFGRFPLLDPALRELPGMFANPFAPENLVALIGQNDADVRAITFPIEHGETPMCLSERDCSTFAAPRKAGRAGKIRS